MKFHFFNNMRQEAAGGATSVNSRSPVLALFFLFALHAAALQDRFLSTVDDAYITFRYSRNWVEGWGLVFNRGGVRVEGLNNYLWIAFGAPFEALGLPTPEIAVWTGWLASLAAALLVVHLLADSWGRARWVAAILLGLWSPFIIWSLGGMETGVYGLAVTALVYAHYRLPRCAKGRTAMGLLWLVVPLLRPEGILLSSAFALLWLIASIRERRGASAYLPVGLFGSGYIGFQVWRFLYFSYPFPNTFYHKMAFTPLFDRWANGASYLLRFFNDTGAWLLIPFWIAAVFQRRWAPAMALLIGLLSIVHMGGDWMNHYRFVAPLEPLMILLAFQGAAALAQRVRWAPQYIWIAPIAFVIAWSLPATVRFSSNPSTYLGWHIPTGKWLGQVAPEGTRILLHDMGALPYYAPQLHVLDALRLTDPITAHAPHLDAIDVGLAVQPDMIVVHPVHAPRQDDTRIEDYRIVPGWGQPLHLPVGLAKAFPEAWGLGMLRVRADLIDEAGEVRLPRRATPRRANPEEKRKAKKLYREGAHFWKSGDLERSIELFKESRALWPAYAWSLHRLEQAKLALVCRDQPNRRAELKPSYESYRLLGEKRACD